MTTTTTRNYPATERTVKYIQDLLDERDLEKSQRFLDDTQSMDREEVEQYKTRLRQAPRSMTQEQASAWIERLKELPRKGQAQPQGPGLTQMPDVPAGRYAITGEDGTTDFYRVDRPTEGRWAGYTFVKLVLGGGFTMQHGYGKEREERMSRSASATILAKIAAAGPEEASKRYGRELGSCGVCGRTLTNPESIERGIGPVCAGKHNWSF